MKIRSKHKAKSMGRNFFIGSVGEPTRGYDEVNLERCIKYKCHAMHQNTTQKGVFSKITHGSILFLKFKRQLVAYGEVVNYSTEENEELSEWNYVAYVKEWIWHDKLDPQKGISNYGVGEATKPGAGGQATIKEIEQAFALQKMKEVDDQSNLYKQVKTEIGEIEMKEKIDGHVKLLETNRNLILTGAPGTGKTYLAKQIATEMIGCNPEELEKNEQFGFVQFHPSYDYTDFVEGLRPLKTTTPGHLGFERKDGIFKDFCERTLIEAEVEKVINRFIDRAINNKTTFKTITGNEFNIHNNGEHGHHLVSVNRLDGKKGEDSYFTKKHLIDRVRGLKKGELKNAEDFWSDAVARKIKFVFVIDEINRGEISKIFGELFFSIDPGYRGTIGAVKTQYSNMQDKANVFDTALGFSESKDCGHFFVPENVYIIGTMNDIDRSVESFDFAMRRRFVWEEITAKDSQIMFERESWKDEAIKRMNALNDVIYKDKDKHIDGLSSSYHIGGAYFKSFLTTGDDEDFKNLWKLRLEPLLKEYLRGMPNQEDKLKELENAYRLVDKKESADDIAKDNG